MKIVLEFTEAEARELRQAAFSAGHRSPTAYVRKLALERIRQPEAKPAASVSKPVIATVQGEPGPTSPSVKFSSRRVNGKWVDTEPRYEETEENA